LNLAVTYLNLAGSYLPAAYILYGNGVLSGSLLYFIWQLHVLYPAATCSYMAATCFYMEAMCI
jgi:hypothetical protein